VQIIAGANQPKQQAADKAGADNSRSATQPIVVQMPRERVNFTAATCSFVGGVCILLMLIAGVIAALHIPMVVKVGAPAWEGVVELDKEFAGSNWPMMFEKVLWMIALGFGFAAVVFKVFGRRIAGVWHMMRGVVSIVGMMATLAALSDIFRGPNYSEAAGNPGVILENMMKYVDDGAVVLAVVIFIISIVLLAWPAKKKDMKYIAVDNSNIGER
jgi:hypothetical protein